MTIKSTIVTIILTSLFINLMALILCVSMYGCDADTVLSLIMTACMILALYTCFSIEHTVNAIACILEMGASKNQLLQGETALSPTTGE